MSEAAAEVFPEAHAAPVNEAHEQAAHEAPAQASSDPHEPVHETHDVALGDSASEAGIAAHESMAEVAAEMAAGAEAVFPEAHDAPSAPVTNEPHVAPSADVEDDPHAPVVEQTSEDRTEAGHEVGPEAEFEHQAKPEAEAEFEHAANAATELGHEHEVKPETGLEAEPAHAAAAAPEPDFDSVSPVGAPSEPAHAASSAAQEWDSEFPGNLPTGVPPGPSAPRGDFGHEAPEGGFDSHPDSHTEPHPESLTEQTLEHGHEHEHELRAEVADASERDFVANAAEAAEHDARLAGDAPPFVAEDPDAQHGPTDTDEPFVRSARPAFGHEEDVIDVEPSTPHYGPTIETDPWITPADTRTEPALNLTAPAIAAAATAGPAFIPIVGDDRNDFRIRVEPHDEHRGTDQHPARRVVGWIVAALLLVLLVALLAWWQREPVMSRWPQTVDMYRQACTKLGCVVLPPRNIDQLQIETSTLTQSTQANQFELSMSVHNRAALALAWPSLEISLLDANNQLVIRRVVNPAQYLPAGTDLNAGIGANGRQAVHLQLNANGTTPANYRVLIFYP
jgi:hypothetical protein